MEITLEDSQGMLRYEAIIALSREELRQLRFAASISQVHQEQPIFAELLDLTDDFAL